MGSNGLESFTMRPSAKVFLLCLLCLLLACPACSRNLTPSPSAIAPTPLLSPAPTIHSSRANLRNPFGLMIDGRTARQRVQMAKDLGAVYFRPWDIDATDWRGRCADRACEAALEAGLALVLTVRNAGQSGSTPMPASLPASLDAYRLTIGLILDRYHPEALVIENEENSPLYWSGSPEEYGVILQAACAVAHERGIPCANGGVSSEAVNLATWASYMDQGKPAEACDFARRALIDKEAEAYCDLDSVAELPNEAMASLLKARELLALYKPMGADYINFHWYSPDAQALEEAVAFLELSTGLPALTNEFGLREQSPQALRAIMEKIVQLGLPYAIAFSLDQQAVALQDNDGTLRLNGKTFQEYILRTFGIK
jgi:hypothetical protein